MYHDTAIPEMMTEKQAEATVIALLSEKGPMTTAEIERVVASSGRRCPDKTVLFLTKMKGKGLVKGEVSQERRGWLWSLQ